MNRGRPPKSDQERQDVAIPLRVKQSLKTELEHRARTRKQSLNSYLRSALERLVRGELYYKPKKP